MSANVSDAVWRRAGGVALLSLCTAAGLCGGCAAQASADDACSPTTQPQFTIRTVWPHVFHPTPPPPTTQAAATQPAPATTMSATLARATFCADPHDDADFQAMQKVLADAPDQPQLIVLACGKYLAHQVPGPLSQEVGAVQEKALDEIWWKKIDQLCRRRQDQRRKLDENAARRAAQNSAANPPAALAEEKAALERELADTQEQLRDMRYLAEQPPPLSDPAKMDLLRQARDPQVYSWWKSLEIQKIADAHGAAW